MKNRRIDQFAHTLTTPCLIEAPADLLYLTGLTLSKGRLLVSSQESILFVDGRYYEKAKQTAPCKVCLWAEWKDIPFKEVGFDSSFVSYESYLLLQKELPNVQFVPIANPLKKIRAVKDQDEISCLKKAAALTWKGYQRILEVLQEGISEEEVALEFEIFCRKNGASGLSFSPIIAFGENSAYPHHRAGKDRLRKDQIVLIDIGAVVDHYAGDMTRMFHFGKVDPKLIWMEDLVRKAQQAAIDLVQPGICFGALDSLVREIFQKENVKQLYTHNLGHGIGLDTHEYPRIRFDGEDKDVILEPGMVFTIEPGLYQPGLGGIRIEDMILVTDQGHTNLYAEI
jgi:Xaa-Pro aminopeptidase